MEAAKAAARCSRRERIRSLSVELNRRRTHSRPFSVYTWTAAQSTNEKFGDRSLFVMYVVGWRRTRSHVTSREASARDPPSIQSTGEKRELQNAAVAQQRGVTANSALGAVSRPRGATTREV